MYIGGIITCCRRLMPAICNNTLVNAKPARCQRDVTAAAAAAAACTPSLPLMRRRR